MKVLLTGSRTWTKAGPVQALMLGMREATFILGDAPAGLDVIALQVAKKNNLKFILKEAEWGKHEDCWCVDKTKNCNYAGHRRNQDMVDEKPDVGFAFRMPGISNGTDDCTRRCFFAGIPVYQILPVDEKTEGIATQMGLRKKKYNSMLEG